MNHRRFFRSLALLLALAGSFWPGLGAAQGVEPALPAATPTATPPELHPSVLAVGVHNSQSEQRNVKVVYAQRGDVIWVDVANLDKWIDTLGAKNRTDHQLKDLILYLDHFPLLGVHPLYSWQREYYTPNDSNGHSAPYTVTTVGFSLDRNDTSKTGWSHLLNQPVFNRKVIVAVGFSDGTEIDTVLNPDEVDNGKLDQQFYLVVIPELRTAVGLVVILGALFAFLSLARYTHIIRDATAPRRPDGLRPYSLARAQMAFWFFLVIASYFFLWIVTGDMNTLNASVLGLIGISAGTALSSAFVDASKPVTGASSGNVPTVDVTKPHLEVVEELNKLRSETLKELEALQKARALLVSTDKVALEENERQQNEVRERLANYRWQSAYFAWPTWKGVMYDLLAENNLISFHRFQIFVWTLVLGIMFVANVYNELAMPEFSSTLLGLLGLSAGTFVGFKLPESKPA